ncbi:MAG: imidazole glycerol phosphate synthase subunit HisH [Anaerolinea sp.]|nr:imidazole glycerol phosphate synthase subunit HisH [Anaerolinea sp.]
MRIAVISDVHGNAIALEAVLTAVAQDAPDQIICLGDVVVTGPQPRAALDLVRALGCPVVMGNTDEWVLSPTPFTIRSAADQILYDIERWGAQRMEATDLAFIRTFQPTVKLDLGHGRSLLCFHGSPRHNKEIIKATTPDDELAEKLGDAQADIMAGGHTHAVAASFPEQRHSQPRQRGAAIFHAARWPAAQPGLGRICAGDGDKRPLRHHPTPRLLQPGCIAHGRPAKQYAPPRRLSGRLDIRRSVMTQTITMIDYGASNIRSAQKAFEHIGATVQLTADPDVVRRADKLVLPGVGAFGSGMDGLRRYNLPAAIHEAVGRGVPFLGICVGMQLMFDEGHEMGIHQGLSLLPGKVIRFPAIVNPSTSSGQAQDKLRTGSSIVNLKIPHMGWNQLEPARQSSLLAEVQTGDYVYFVHSYYCEPVEETAVLAWTNYGFPFASVVAKDNLYGLQFHPEKSQRVGLQILRNFVAMA